MDLEMEMDLEMGYYPMYRGVLLPYSQRYTRRYSEYYPLRRIVWTDTSPSERSRLFARVRFARDVSPRSRCARANHGRPDSRRRGRSAGARRAPRQIGRDRPGIAPR